MQIGLPEIVPECIQGCAVKGLNKTSGYASNIAPNVHGRGKSYKKYLIKKIKNYRILLSLLLLVAYLTKHVSNKRCLHLLVNYIM